MVECPPPAEIESTPASNLHGNVQRERGRSGRPEQVIRVDCPCCPSLGMEGENKAGLRVKYYSREGGGKENFA